MSTDRSARNPVVDAVVNAVVSWTAQVLSWVLVLVGLGVVADGIYVTYVAKLVRDLPFLLLSIGFLIGLGLALIGIGTVLSLLRRIALRLDALPPWEKT